jgi:GT2 family glycosyltransferase|tara:strand:+ start:1370 stop:2374 length:1005 start_codon:yes stop_codon:yes gene_type:complete
MSVTAIVILNYNGIEFLKKYLGILIKNSGNYEVIVADNGSTDSSLDWLKKNHSGIRAIVLNKNNGYAGGYNLALKEVVADYYALINSDVETTQNWLDPLVQFLEEHPDYSAIQPKILDQNDASKFEHAGAAGGQLDAWGYPFCRGRIFDTIENDLGQYDDAIDVFWTSGACMVIRAQDFNDIGGFDADFFAHMEEIDLCWRLALKGKKFRYTPKSTVHHVGGGTLAASHPQKTYLNFRNGLAMLLKNLPKKHLIKIPFRMILDLGAAFVFWKHQGFSHFKAVCRAELDFMLNLRKYWRNRNQHRQPEIKLHYPVESVALQYFLLKKKTYNELNQ